MPGDEGKRFQGLQQGWQYGHDVIHYGIAHRDLRRNVNAAAGP
jgi:hypothetical protein